ncbi:MAG TPA: hypothetical protein VL361_19810 [Candidatus Limnocylindrales bacterium]|jgi:hypothetical protein|nr:hypothetical protein [Candidatus Limnocylindrales bacterium]
MNATATGRSSGKLVKEFRPLLLPAIVAVVGSITPPVDDVSAIVGTLACFGGFALLAAMTFGLEFQQRTLPLLLSQPIPRSHIWGDKLLVVFLAGILLLLLNWQFQQLLADLQALSLLMIWMFFVATVCASGFWIRSTGSLAGGIACSLANQLVIFSGLIVALRRASPYYASSANEVLLPVFLASIVYILTFLWLGRRFWKGTVLKVGGATLLVLLMIAVSHILAGGLTSRTWESRGAELCLTGLFMLGLACSAGFWTLLARTTIGGAALSVASQFLAGLAVMFGLARVYGVDPNIEQWRFLGPLMLFATIYCTVFQWLGWRKFARLELRESAAENVADPTGFFYRGGWSAAYLRCRPHQHFRNLVRKELRLQKPLLTLAGLSAICWLAAFGIQWLRPEYRILSDVVMCVYAPVALLLAGCVSQGDEKALGLTAWHLTLPISTQIQWLVKLLVSAGTGFVLGLLLPLCLHLLSATANGAGWMPKSHVEGYETIGFLSGALFILSFWAATLLSNTVRAALSAVIALFGLFLCGMAGGWCAEHLELLRMAVSPLYTWLVIPLSSASGVLNPAATTLYLGLGLGTGVALLQSYRQFRRVQLPGTTLIKAPLLLAVIFVLVGFVLYSTDYLARG